MTHLYEQVLTRIETQLVQKIDEGSAGIVFQDLTGKIVRVSDAPIARGAITSVWSGELFGNSVSIFTSTQTSRNISEDLATLKVSGLVVQIVVRPSLIDMSFRLASRGQLSVTRMCCLCWGLLAIWENIISA